MRVLDELGFYVLAGQPKSSRAILVDEVRDGEALGLGTAFISERYNKKEAATLSGAAGAVSERIRDRDRGDEPQHPAPDRHRRLRAHDAEPHRRTLRARSRARHPACCRTRSASPASRPRRWRTSPASCAGCSTAKSIIGHDGPAGKFPVLHLDASLDEYLPMSIVAFGPNTLALGGPLLRRGRAAHLLHRRDDGALRADGEARGRGGRPRSRVGARLVVLRDDRRPPPRRQAADEVGRPARHLPPGLRRPARAHQRLGSGTCSSASSPTRRAERPGPRRGRHDRAARARRDTHSRRVARAERDRHPRNNASPRCGTSSRSAATA